MYQCVAVIGAGQMGTDIAQVVAQFGYNVTLIDVQESLVEASVNRIRGALYRLVEKGKLSAQLAEETLGRISTGASWESASAADIIIEAITEDVALKQKLFAEMDRICKPETILASNTSAISITLLASVTQHPERVIGMHFTKPVPVMKLVEIIPGLDTAPETISTITELARKLGKEPVQCKDYTGFIGTRIAMVYLNEAFHFIYSGLASVEDVDKSLKLGANHPLGPLELADFIGLDTVLSILRNLYETYGEQKYFPSPLLVQMVRAGKLGRKTGVGFYKY